MRHNIIWDNRGVSDLREYLKDKEIVAIDCETTGVTSSSEIIGYSVCCEPDQAFYVVTAYWDVASSQLKYTECKDTAPDVMRDLIGKKLIAHNGIFDCWMIENNYKVSLIDSLFADTMIMANLIDENRSVGLKELAESMYGISARKEQQAVRESVTNNGGQLTKKNYELYKADPNLLGEYGSQDVILTLSLFYDLLPLLEEEGMWDFYFNDESMPLLRGPTYHLNTTGLKVDMDRLQKLKKDLEVESAELCAFIDKEITPYIKEKYPATKKSNTFNIDSREQLAWLLYERLANQFIKLSNSGGDLCIALEMKRPYTNVAKRQFIAEVKERKGQVWRQKGTWDPRKKKKLGEAKVKDYWTYLSTDKAVLQEFARKYEWVAKLLELRKVDKLLGTYVNAILERAEYGVIRPSFLQHGTTSGRYSSRYPNFQNLPRGEARLKACIVARPGKVFVGADEQALEPRIFASYSKDERLIGCFASGQDFYSVIGAEVFEIKGCSLIKSDDENFFGNKHEPLRFRTKVGALSATYGTTAPKMAPALGVEVEEAQHFIDSYFEKFPSVEAMMLEAHALVKKNGYVENLFGRKRRIPEAMKIERIYGRLPHNELPYAARNLLNLAVNHRIQSTGASIINRASIRFLALCKDAGIEDVRIVLQVHDELIAECNEEDGEAVALLLKEAMEHTVELPGVALVAEPKIGRTLAETK